MFRAAVETLVVQIVYVHEFEATVVRIISLIWLDIDTLHAPL
jgi:hypothetical protein